MEKNKVANNSQTAGGAETVARELLIGNVLGLHGRPSARLVETASRFAADIRLEKGGEEVDAKSILDVLSVACGQGTVITVRAAGPDAAAAVAAIAALVDGKFGEE